MPSSAHRTRGSSGSSGRRPIKTEPGAHTVIVQPPRSTNFDDDGASTQIALDRSYYPPLGRSDAPPPSERTEPEILLREVRDVRARSHAAAESPRSSDESFFHTSFQDIGKKLKECNDTLGELQQLGVSHDVQLPELVLVGDQSAGKSSLMSGLANLDLPRSEGTCTRCPLHIRVSRNIEWSCRVWLRKEYVYQPPNRAIDETDVTAEDPFFPWRKMPNTAIHEFKTMHDKSEIEDVLRWAQIAILNDDKNLALFVPGSGSIAMNMDLEKAAEETPAKFSPNIVALEIKGPELPDLSFYDMPGIFQNPADANDNYLVNVVRNLSREYIQHPSAIIICSMPMNSDAENSSTFSLTRRLCALDRTIGVLTKADLLPDGKKHNQWLDIMNGKAHATGLGYFITSRPQDKDLEQLKQWEELIFESHGYERWPQAFHGFESRCGVEKLKAFLSERLGEEFAKSLPNIKQKVRIHLEKVTKQLANLPELPKNVELEIQTSLNGFADSARARIDGFVGRINNLPANFRDCLLEIKPKFTLKDKTDIPVVDISDDESDAGSVATAIQGTPSRKRGMPAHNTPSKRPRHENPNGVNAGTPTGVHIKPEHTNGTSFPPPGTLPPPVRKAVLAEPFAQFSDVGRGFRTIRQVRDEIQAKMKAGMPNIIPPEVYNDLAMESIRPWNRPTEVFLKQIIRLLQSELEAALNTSLESLKKRQIYYEAKRQLKSCLDEHFEVTQRALVELYNDETHQVLTFNEESFDRCIRSEEAALFRFRHSMRMIAQGYPMKPLVPWENLTEDKQAVELKRRETEMAKLGPDKFEREVKVVAYIRGYYRLAALRYADAVSQRIICRMIPAVRRQLRNYLDDKLGVGRGATAEDLAEVYERLMKEEPVIAQKRELLKNERDKFHRAMASIEVLETGATVRAASVIETGYVAIVEDSGESDMTMDRGEA